MIRTNLVLKACSIKDHKICPLKMKTAHRKCSITDNHATFKSYHVYTCNRTVCVWLNERHYTMITSEMYFLHSKLANLSKQNKFCVFWCTYFWLMTNDRQKQAVIFASLSDWLLEPFWIRQFYGIFCHQSKFMWIMIQSRLISAFKPEVTIAPLTSTMNC